MTARSVRCCCALASLTPGAAPRPRPWSGPRPPVSARPLLLWADLTARRGGPVLRRTPRHGAVTPDRLAFAAHPGPGDCRVRSMFGRRVAAAPAPGPSLRSGRGAAPAGDVRLPRRRRRRGVPAVRVATGRISAASGLPSALMPRSAAGASACSSAPAQASSSTSPARRAAASPAPHRSARRRHPQLHGRLVARRHRARVDHLTARSRRTAIGLVLLGGGDHPIGLTGAVYRFVTPDRRDAEGNLAALDDSSGARGQPRSPTRRAAG